MREILLLLAYPNNDLEIFSKVSSSHILKKVKWD